MKITPLNDSIIIEFLDEIRDGAFVPQTKSGIILTNKNTDDSGQSPRWCRTIAVGPDVKDVKEGDYVLVAPLRWTPSFKFGDDRYSKTIEDEILLIADDIEDISELFL